MALLGKVLPMQVVGEDGGPVQVAIAVTDEQRAKAMALLLAKRKAAAPN